VAKQEAALTQLSTRLNDSYAKLRRQSVIEFEFFAGYACTGLGTPPADYAKAGKDPYSEALNIDIRACLYQQLMQFPPLYELTKEDRGLLVLELDRIGKELNIIRLSTIAEVDKLRAAHPLKGPIALGPDYMFWLGLMKQSGASEREFVEMQKLMSFNYQRDILVEPYLRKVRDGIASLSRINWAPPAAPK
jgi:hypothetical protein